MPKRKTLLLVFIHGFKGTDHTFHSFPRDLQTSLAAQLPGLDIVILLFPQYETRGDLKDCVARFKEWLQNKVIDLEVANKTPSPTVDPSVHVVLCGHSMGGIVAAEALMSVVRDGVVPPMGGDRRGSVGGAGYANDTTNSTTRRESITGRKKPTSLDVPEPAGRGERSSSAPPEEEHSRLLFPYIQAVLAFDTPYLGISPGVLAHGAEEHINHASSAYKAYDTASNIFGWGKAATPQANASAGALPAANGAGGWSKWGKYAAFAGAAAGIAGAAGAAYLNWDQINQGLAWAGSHLEFVGCLARGAELQRRVESVVELERTHGVGFANFYCTLGDKVTSQTKYAGAVLGTDRSFCVIPKSTTQRSPDSPTGTKRNAPASSSQSQQNPPSKRRKAGQPVKESDDRTPGEQVQEYAQDERKWKGKWVKCVNEKAGDELRAHTSMFQPERNPDYKAMVPRARDQILGWIGDGGEWGAEEEEMQDEGGGAEEGEGEGEGVEEEEVEGGAKGKEEDVAMEDELPAI